MISDENREANAQNAIDRLLSELELRERDDLFQDIEKILGSFIEEGNKASNRKNDNDQGNKVRNFIKDHDDVPLFIKQEIIYLLTMSRISPESVNLSAIVSELKGLEGVYPQAAAVIESALSEFSREEYGRNYAAHIEQVEAEKHSVANENNDFLLSILKELDEQEKYYKKYIDEKGNVMFDDRADGLHNYCTQMEVGSYLIESIGVKDELESDMKCMQEEILKKDLVYKPFLVQGMISDFFEKHKEKIEAQFPERESNDLKGCFVVYVMNHLIKDMIRDFRSEKGIDQHDVNKLDEEKKEFSYRDRVLNRKKGHQKNSGALGIM